MQIQTANDITTTMAQYEKVIGAKTAALFAAACEIGPVIAGAGAEAQASMRAYGHNLGMAFQVADDILDYTADQAKLGKTVGDDFREGKMTAPVILALSGAAGAEKDFWIRTLEKKSQTADDLPRAQEILRRTGALDRGMEMAHDYARKAQTALNAKKGDALGTALHDLADFAVGRSY